MAKLEFKLPDIGEGVSEGEIVSWLVKVGDRLEADQDMVEVMTDKATVTIGAPDAGVVAEVRAQEGDTVPVGEVLVVLETGGGAPAAETEASSAAPSATPAGPAASAAGDIKEDLAVTVATAAHSAPSAAQSGAKPLAAPATRKLARELGVDLAQVPPTGEAGRVTREDVQAFAAGGGRPSAPAAQPSSAPVPPAAPVPVGELEERIPLRGMRKRIYENMARVKRTAAHFTYVDECECTPLRGLRARLKPLADQGGINLTFLPFIVKAVVAALKKNPSLNALIDDSSQEIVLRKTYDIGIAVATPAGLIVPVLRNADKLTLVDIGREIERLATDARDGKTPREDLGGSSFTITSLGKLGGLLATPVLNYPEVGILYVPEMKKVPVVVGDEIKVGYVMALSLSFDHRVINGADGAAFTKDVIALLQEPDRLILEL